MQRPLPLPHRLPSSAGSSPRRGPRRGPCQGPRRGPNSGPKRARRQGRQPPGLRPVRDGNHRPDRAPRAGLHGSRQASRPPVERAGPKKMKAHVAETSLAPHRRRGRLPHPRGVGRVPMPSLAPPAGYSPRRQARYSRWNPAKSTRRMERNRETRETQALGPAWEKVRLRFPSSARRRPWRCAVPPHSAPRPARDSPTRVAQRSSRVRHEASAGRGTRAGHDRRKVVFRTVVRIALQVALQALRPGYGAKRSPVPYRSKQARPEQGRSGPPLRGGRPSGPRPARFGAPDAGAPRSDNPRSENRGRPFPRPSRPGVRPGGPRPPSTGGAGQDTRPKPNPRGTYNERPRPAGYARPGGKPGPGGGGKGRSDRRREPGPRPPFVPGSRPAKSWPRTGGSSAKPGKPSFRGRKPDRKKPGA